MKHFRVDKMDGIDIVYQKREGKDAFKELKLTERSLRTLLHTTYLKDDVKLLDSSCNIPVMQGYSFIIR